MGNKNTVSHDYMSENEHFSDAINFFMFDGEKVVLPENLDTEDVNEEAIIHKYDRLFSTQKIRDIVKRVTIKSDKNTTYVIIGVENQSDIHYAMVVRNLLYDALCYSAQVAAIAKQNRKEGKVSGNAEFLSGFTKADKIKPVITLVINWSKDKWDGPRKLSEMMIDTDPRINEWIDDYNLKLIDPHDIEDFTKFSSELGDVLEFIKRQNDDNYINDMKREKE
ncbi:Rpn family recombination-promoting nuclease/putative transposase [Butyrivibrio sp. YAB3001]|uniref:Rpn family recombination-promoting nuclease/putative transposase n=1 Tax=Butyrivibrio sp. YAB3001 TaxID=1520812 RepID=UPI0008F61916|nr:Rpn family recombination-promoting nuclease/putative transposase [Butyrivibrio sp. YAB3001]SFC07390.1 Putative transposase, YhgA-like [Butyrivibrio sp. YAB3001]